MKARTRLSLTALAAAAALGTTAAVTLPAASAQPLTAAHTRTLRFTSVNQAQLSFSKTVSIAEDKDVNQAGKVIGYDVIRFDFNPTTVTALLSASIELKGGFLYGQLHETNSPVGYGKVTGGTGVFKGATGTITAKTLDANGDRTAVTITYCTAG
jgi:hypothetical protein